VDAADAERRRLIDPYQSGFIELPEMQRRATEIPSRQKELQHKRTNVADERSALALTTSSATAHTTSPTASHGVVHFGSVNHRVRDQRVVLYVRRFRVPVTTIQVWRVVTQRVPSLR
jgi:hypothetical protein